MIHTGITLEDVEIGTKFHYEGTDYEKGSSGTGAPDGGYTVCHPKRGGLYQHGKKFETQIPNRKY